MTDTPRADIGYERVLDRRQDFSRTVALGPRHDSAPDLIQSPNPLLAVAIVFFSMIRHCGGMAVTSMRSG